MKRNISLIGLIIALTCVSQAQEGAMQPVALVTAVQGGVTLRQGAAESPLTLGARLSEGSAISVASGMASLVFLTGELISLKDHEELTLGATLENSMLNTGGNTRGLASNDGTSVADDGFAVGSDGDVWQAQLASVSGIRGDAMAIAISPRLTLSEPRPVFCWFDTDSSAIGIERDWVLYVKDEQGKLVVTQQVKGKVGVFNTWQSERMPDGFQAEPRKRYSWAVFPTGAAPSESELDAVFVYVDAEGMQHAASQRKKLAGLREKSALDEMSWHMLSCTFALDERERLFADAIPHLLALGATTEGRAWAAEQLAHTFLRFGGQVSALAPRAALLSRDMIQP